MKTSLKYKYIQNLIKKWCLQPIRLICLSFVLLFAVLLVTVHITIVQQKLLLHTLSHVHQHTGYHIECDDIRVNILNDISLTHVKVTDPAKNTLLTIEHFHTTFSPLRLLWFDMKHIHSIAINGMQLYLQETTVHSTPQTAYEAMIVALLFPKEALYTIKHIHLEGGNIHCKHPLNEQIIAIKDISLDLKNYVTNADHTSGEITSLSYKAPHMPLQLQGLSTNFHIKPHEIILKQCKLHTQKIQLRGDFKLSTGKVLLPLLVKTIATRQLEGGRI